MLIGIGFFAGIVTAISPCVLPVLPILLAGGAAGRKPLRIIGGLVLSFSVFTLFASWLLDTARAATGPAAQPRDRAAVRDGGRAARSQRSALWVEQSLSLFSRLRPANAGGGFFLGVTLGLVFVPCAGPFLAAVTTAAAREDFGARTIAATVAYSIGAAIPMLLIARGGREAAARIKEHAATLRTVSGVVVAAVALGPRLPRRRSPRKLDAGLHDVLAEQDREQRLGVARAREGARRASAAAAVQSTTGGLPDYGLAPPLKPDGAWINTQPLTLAQLRGKVVLDRLLDVLVHQLPAHAAAPQVVVRDVPQGRLRDHRRAHSRVRVRTRHFERARRREAARDHLSRRAGQPVQDVGRVREPVLAGGVPDRQDRPHPSHELRRRRVREDREPDPATARREGREGAPGRRRDADGAADAGDVPGLFAAVELRRHHGLTGQSRRTTSCPLQFRRTRSRTAAGGASAGRR